MTERSVQSGTRRLSRRMASITQAREIIGKNPDSYKRFENYDTRRPAKKAWGEVLEQFLRSRGPCVGARALAAVAFPCATRPRCGSSLALFSSRHRAPVVRGRALHQHRA